MFKCMGLAGTIVGAVLGFAVAILVEPIKSRLYGPRLKVFFGDSSEFQTKTHERLTTKNAKKPNNQETSYHKASYIRIKVTNTKAALAKGCRAYLVKVEKQHYDGKFHDTIYCDSIPLAWSCRDNRRFLPVDIPKDVNQFVDLVSTREISKDYRPEIEVSPYRYTDLWQKHGIFRFTVQVSGENVKPVFIKVEFAWDRQWDKYLCKLVR